MPGDAQVCPSDGAAAENVEQLPSGAKIGDYKVVRLLGEGGMGYVYEALHEVLHRRTAMKFLRPEFAVEPEVVTRFMQEAKAVNLVDHENIVNVYDIGDAADGSVYFVMEYLEGQDLADVQSGRPLPLALLVHVYGQVLRALAAAHAKHIVHRDLKPANVFITKREGNPYFVKLLDFGVAKLRGASSRGITQQGAVLGTPNYMSPEQIQGLSVDHRSDIFTIGIMLYRAATGVAPFTGDSFGELAGQILNKDPAPLRQVLPTANLPAALERLVQKAMQKRVEDRYQSVAELLLDLEAVKREARLDDQAMRAALAELAGRPLDDVLPARGSQPATRASLAESNPVFQGVPAAVAGAAPASTSGASGSLATAASTSGGAKKKPPVLWLAGGALVAAVLAVIVFGRGGAKPAAAPAGGTATTTTSQSGTATGPGATLATKTQEPSLDDVTGSKGDGYAALRAAGDGAKVRAQAEAQLTAALAADDAARQGQVVAALALVGSARTAPLLYQALAGSPDLRVRAARALRELKLPEAAAKLRAVLDDSGDKVRIDLAAAMAVLGDKDADAVLKAALADAAQGLTAAAALAEAGRGGAGKKLLAEVLAQTPVGRDRWRVAAEALARLGDKPAQQALAGELAQPDPRRAVAAAEALMRLGDDAGSAYLERVVADTSFAVRPLAALALAKGGGAGALAFVAAGLASTDADTRMSALAVVARLAGQGGTAHLDAVATIADADPDARVRVVAQAVLMVATP
jgi:HEAT repeat protein/tRNA A-37 threonylcarbamoyl transferase component Bud32